MFLILKIIVFLFFFVTFDVIISCGQGGHNNTNTRKSRSRSSKDRKHGNKHDKDKKNSSDNVDGNAAGKDVFKRPDVLGMALADDPNYATLKKVDVDKLLGDVGEKQQPPQSSPAVQVGKTTQASQTPQN